MTQAPTPGPLSAEDVKLLVKLLDTLKPFAEVAEKLKHCHVVEICEPSPDNPSRNIIPMPREWFERAGDDLEYIAIQLHASGVLSEGQASKITGLDRVSVRREIDHLAPTAPVEESGSEDLAGKLTAIRDKFLLPTPDKDFTDYAIITRCIAALRPQPSGETLQSLAQAFEDAMEGSHGAWAVSGDEGPLSATTVADKIQADTDAKLTDCPSGETREAVLKGVGKINGDGWKDTTTEGEIVFVWNAEKPAPYAPGQYPRVGNEGWSASTSQYDFTPATADDVPAILALIRPAAPGGGEAWAWLAAHPSMELGHCYGDEDDDPAWQVHERSGNRSDREWRLVASGPTPLEAVLAAIPASEGGEG